jgi:hypothetical protein
VHTLEPASENVPAGQDPLQLLLEESRPSTVPTNPGAQGLQVVFSWPSAYLPRGHARFARLHSTRNTEQQRHCPTEDAGIAFQSGSYARISHTAWRAPLPKPATDGRQRSTR